jgi:NAD(P)-dependent dehydrogenase (short-subunit alcohol dehydrogenase family)
MHTLTQRIEAAVGRGGTVTFIDGVVLGTRAIVPVLRAKGGGAIVSTASVAGIVAFSPNPLYTLTKQAVTGFVQALAPNLVADHITFNAVCPGVVDTPMTVEALDGGDPDGAAQLFHAHAAGTLLPDERA